MCLKTYLVVDFILDLVKTIIYARVSLVKEKYQIYLKIML
jgi:hypothetical protein